ncbi:MAG: 16S rRNA (guanine(527)-N(7))-methyltransferase RsmG [Caldisericia bacterium]
MTIDKKMLIDGVTPFGVTLSDYQLEQFEEFFKILITWNKKFNLTAITNPDEVVSKHFVDSLIANAFLPEDKTGVKHIDIGSGSGLPGVALNIAFPEIETVLVESIGKKARFLETLTKELELKNIKVINVRVEDLPALYPEYNSYFNFTTARAVGRLLWLLELAAPTMHPESRIVLWKGRDQISGLPKLINQIRMRGFDLEETKAYKIPLWNIDRFLISLKRL